MNCELLRFGIVGALATVIQFVAYYLLVLLMNHNIALPLSYVISLTVNFFLIGRASCRERV